MFTVTESITLRPVVPADQPFLDHLYFTSRGDLQQLPAEPQFVAQLIHMQHHLHMAGVRQNFPVAQHWLVLQHEKAIGRLIADIGEADIRLVDVILLPQAQGQGVGKALLRGLQRYAAHRHLAISLAVSRTNAVARKLYAGAGFALQASDDLMDQMRWPGAVPLQASVEAGHAG